MNTDRINVYGTGKDNSFDCSLLLLVLCSAGQWDDTHMKGESGQYHCPKKPKTAPSSSTLKGKAAGPMDRPRMVKTCHIRHRPWLADATSCKVPGARGLSDGKSKDAKASPTHPSSPHCKQLVNLICDPLTSCTPWVVSQQQGVALQVFVTQGIWKKGREGKGEKRQSNECQLSQSHVQHVRPDS